MRRLARWVKRLFARTSIPSPWAQPEYLNPWLDQASALDHIAAKEARGELDAETAAGLQQWHRDGYIILPNLIDGDRVQAVIDDFHRFDRERAIVGGHRRPMDRGNYGHWNPCINVHMQSDAVKAVFLDPTIMRWLGMILGKPVYGCQSINFFNGSNRRLHHDHIHMTTRPYGYLAAAWIALEDIDPRSGPLLYVPGSQWLPYVTTTELHARTQAGEDVNDALGNQLEERIRSRGLEVKRFLARKGDVLLWHCNLVHGGAPIDEPSLSRFSMACHYAGFGVEYFHELSGLQRDPSDVEYFQGQPYLPELYDQENRLCATRREWLARQQAAM